MGVNGGSEVAFTLFFFVN